MHAEAPVSLTSFIGREEEVRAIRRLLESTRLLTLTGAGGSGKTRLASEVASPAVSRFADGIVWVELAPLADPTLLPNHLIAALGADQGARTPVDTLLDTIRARELLIVLDNCEHLVDACATLTERLLRAAPKLRILATSREALGVEGERAWLVPGLSLPRGQAGSGASMDTIAASDAVKLFVDRAQAAIASFELTPSNADAVAQICRRLDGLPLAIELAAARVRALPPEQLAKRLDNAFRALGTAGRTAVPRHRTLREAIDWSYNLLDSRERALLQRLSPFAGDFTLEAAEAVAAEADFPAEDILDSLGALVDKSLVVMREAEGTARYYVLETIRQYGAARLEEAGNAAVVAERHARAYVSLVAEAAPHFVTRARPKWATHVQRELDNIRIALAWTREHDAAEHVRLAGMLGWFWYSSGLWSEGRRWLEGAIAIPACDELLAARAATLLGAGVLASLQADVVSAVPWLEECIAIARRLDDRRTESYALGYIGVAYGQSGDERALAPLERAIAWFREDRDLYGLRLGLVVLSTYWLVRGEVPRAREIAEEAAAIARAFGLDRELAIALQVLGTAVLTVGDVAQATEHFRDAGRALRRDPSTFWMARWLHLFGQIICRTGDTLRGARLLGAAEKQRESIGARLVKHDADRLAPVIAAAREKVGEDAFAREWNAGRAQSLDEILALAGLDDAPVALTPEVGRPTPDVDAALPARAPSVPLDVRALGSLEIFRDGARLSNDAWRYARPRELLLYLLAHPGGRTREQIGLTFWPDASTTQVKNNFHVMLHHLRKALGRADLIAFDGERYRIAWDLGVRFDARTFEELMRPAVRELRNARNGSDGSESTARVEAATTLYRGDFLADEGAGDWHLEIRDELRRLYAEGTLLLGARRMASGAYKEAADAFRRAIAMDELHEEAHRRLMLSLARAGERAEALRQYDRLARTLRADLEAEPEPETRALYDRLRRAEPV